MSRRRNKGERRKHYLSKEDRELVGAGAGAAVWGVPGAVLGVMGGRRLNPDSDYTVTLVKGPGREKVYVEGDYRRAYRRAWALAELHGADVEHTEQGFVIDATDYYGGREGNPSPIEELVALKRHERRARQRRERKEKAQVIGVLRDMESRRRGARRGAALRRLNPVEEMFLIYKQFDDGAEDFAWYSTPSAAQYHYDKMLDSIDVFGLQHMTLSRLVANDEDRYRAAETIQRYGDPISSNPAGLAAELRRLKRDKALRSVAHRGGAARALSGQKRAKILRALNPKENP